MSRWPCSSGWVNTAAHVNPFTPLIETGRDFIAGTNPDALLAYAIALALLSLFAMWGVRGLRRAEQAG